MSLVELTEKLIEACQEKNKELIKTLIKQGGDPCLILPEREEAVCALHIVAKLGNLKVLRVLVDTCKDSINLEVRDGCKGLTPLLYSSLYGHKDTFAYLISCNCDPHSLTYDGDTALHLACSYLGQTSLEMIKHLVLITKYDVNAQNKNGNTPLIVLIESSIGLQVPSITSFLIFDCSCDLSLKNNDGNTALHAACMSGCVSVVEQIATSISYCIGGNANADSTLTTSHESDCLYLVNNFGEIPIQVAMKSLENRNAMVAILATEMYKTPHMGGNSPLHLACSMNDLELVQMIKKLKCDPNTVNKDGDTPLHLACRQSSHMIVQELLEFGCDFNIENKNGETALTTACKRKSYLVVKTIQKKNICSKLGESPFFLACKHGNNELVSLILKLKWDTNQPSNDGTTPILIAFKNGHLDIVKDIISSSSAQNFESDIMLLLEREVDPSLILAQIKFSQSLSCVVCGGLGDINALKVLSERINFDEIDKNGWTGLHYACHYCNIHIIKYLVIERQCSAVVKGKDSNQTPLHLACIADCETEEKALNVVVFLTSHAYANCDAQTSDGNSPLMLLLQQKKKRNKIAFYLINHCLCDLTLRNDEGQTALHIACAKGNVEVVTMIITKGFNPNIEDNVGSSPLHIACQNGSVETFHQILSSSYCDVEAMMELMLSVKLKPALLSALSQYIHLKRDKDGNTILHKICIIHDIKLARLVAETKCNPNLLNNNCDTPLHIVCRKGYVSIAAILLSMEKCSIYELNKDDETPLDIACQNRFSDLVKILLTKTPTVQKLNDHNRAYLVEVFKRHVNAMSNSPSSVYVKKGLTMLKYIVNEGLQFLDVVDPVKLKVLMQQACGRLGDLNTVTVLARYDDDSHLMSQDSTGFTLLHYACRYGNEDIVKYLVENKSFNAVINKQTLQGETPLHCSCNTLSTEERALSVVKFLTSNPNCDCNLKDNKGNTPLMTLVYNKPSMTKIAHFLIEECKCNLTIENCKGETICHIICSDKLPNLDLVKTIIKASGDFFTRNSDGNNSLHLACKFGHKELIKILLTLEGCDLYERNNEFMTPLQIAEANNHLEVVSHLIYAMYDSLDEERNTPLHIACQARNVRLTKVVIDMTFNVTAANRDGDTPLHIACRQGCLKLVKLLTQYANCDYDYRNLNGDTPLHVACEGGNQIIVHMLMKKCQFHKRKNKSGLTPFHVALQHHNLETAYLLLNDIESVMLISVYDMGESQDINGWTPLHCLCYNGQLTLVEQLLNDTRINPNIADHSGITPLELACHGDCSEEEALKIVTCLITVVKCDPDQDVHGRLLMYLLQTNNNRDNTIIVQTLPQSVTLMATHCYILPVPLQQTQK